MYQPDPTIRCEGQAGTGYESLVKAINAGGPRTVLVDTYHAPGADEFLARLRAEWGRKATWFDTRDALKDPETAPAALLGAASLFQPA